jgi:hypothetical protein
LLRERDRNKTLTCLAGTEPTVAIGIAVSCWRNDTEEDGDGDEHARGGARVFRPIRVQRERGDDRYPDEQDEPAEDQGRDVLRW